MVARRSGVLGVDQFLDFGAGGFGAAMLRGGRSRWAGDRGS
ncbi:MAG: hypothetical protein ACRDYA_25125 [Egibacteraceae bacterium]